jgi:hypothetical protein
MKPRVRKLAVIVGASAALGVAGCGGASSEASSEAPSGSATDPSTAA